MADAENVIDHYEVGNCISSGGTTAIWEARNLQNGQQYAMKLLLPEALKDAEAKAALKHEFNVANSLSHPNVIRVFDFKLTRKHGYFTMEHFRAGNLKVMIRNEPPVAQARAKRVLECVAQALAVMHEKGWVHRDLKPENILVTKGGEIRLIDFALASRPTSMLAKALTRKKNVVIQGTRTYLAPELVQRQPLTFAADMYSLGIVLYEVLTGTPPFRTGNANELLMMHVRDRVVPPSELNPNVTPEGDALIAKMLAKKPKDRPHSMHELFAEARNMKLFKEDPEVFARTQQEVEKERFKQSVDVRLDSRADAIRQELMAKGEYVPEPPKPKTKSRSVLKSGVAKESPKEQKSGAAAPQPPQGQPYPGMPYPHPGYPMAPGYPMPFPGMPMPGMPMGQMPMPGMPYPQQPYPPPHPGAGPPPQVPGGQVPAGHSPAQQGPPHPGAQQPAAQPGSASPRPAGPQPPAPRPAAPKPQAPRAAAPSPAAPPAKPQQADADLPVATSIDDIEIG